MLPREIENTIVEKLTKFFTKDEIIEMLIIQLENLDNPSDVEVAEKFNRDLDEYLPEKIEEAKKITENIENQRIQQRINKSSFKGWIKYHLKKFVYEHTKWYLFENNDIDNAQPTFKEIDDLRGVICEIIEDSLY